MAARSGIRVLLADDHKILRDGLRKILEAESDIEVVAEAGNGREAIKLCCQLKPDIVVMDISMPDVNGIEATRQIIHDVPNTKILPLSMHADRAFVADILHAGAKGYMLKDGAADELVRAVRSLVRGKVYLSPEIADFIAEGFVERHKYMAGGSARDILTPREVEVLQLLAEGQTIKEIAFKLNVSVKTVESHKKNIYDKLNLNNISDLTKYAIREGITSVDH